MSVLAVVSALLLVAAAVGTYRVFSYLAVVLLVGALGVSSIERNTSELDFAPYNGLLAGWAVLFVVGFTGIWFLWNPSVTAYEYVLGVPTETLAYFVFIWLLPILGAFYYASVFPDIGDEEVVDDIMTDAREAQRTREYPLAPDAETDGGEDQ